MPELIDRWLANGLNYNRRLSKKVAFIACRTRIRFLWRLIALGFASVAVATAGTIYWFKGGEKKQDTGSNFSSYPDIAEPQPSPYAVVPTVFQDVSKPRKKQADPAATKTSDNALEKELRRPPATTSHLWLLLLQPDELISETTIKDALGIKPTLGWPTRKSIVLAGFILPEKLRFRKDGIRLLISADDYDGSQLAAITGQAVPIFMSADHAWQFKGFFRFSRPAGHSVACSQLWEPPPELVQLAPASEGPTG